MNEITLEDAAKRLGVSKETMRRMVQSGRVHARKVPSPHGKFRWLVDGDSLPPADPHTITAHDPHEATAPQTGPTVPAVRPEQLLAALEALATKRDIEQILQAVNRTGELETELIQRREDQDRLQERLSEVESELASERRRTRWPWQRGR